LVFLEPWSNPEEVQLERATEAARGCLTELEAVTPRGSRAITVPYKDNASPRFVFETIGKIAIIEALYGYLLEIPFHPLRQKARVLAISAMAEKNSPAYSLTRTT